MIIMINTEVKDLLQLYGFTLKEVSGDTYVFENNHADKVLFDDVRNPIFKIVENSPNEKYNKQFTFDELRAWLVQNQTYSYSVMGAYSFGKFLRDIMPDPKSIGATVAATLVTSLFVTSAKVIGGAVASTIADRLRNLGSKPLNQEFDDAIALVEQARNHIIKNGTPEQRRDFEKKIDDIMHPYVKKFQQKGPKPATYSIMGAYSFRESVASALRSVRDLGADILENVLKETFATCGNALGKPISSNVRRKIVSINAPETEQEIQATAKIVEDTFNFLKDNADETAQKRFAKEVNDALRPKSEGKPLTYKPFKDLNKYYSELETYPRDESLKDLMIEFKDELKLDEDYIKSLFTSRGPGEVYDAVKDIMNEVTVSDEFRSRFEAL